MLGDLNIRIAEDGKTVLTDENLQQLESYFVGKKAGGATNTICDGSNSICRNTDHCDGSINSGQCINTGSCAPPGSNTRCQLD